MTDAHDLTGPALAQALEREHRRALSAEAALAELHRRYELLELRNAELAAIVDAVGRHGAVQAEPAAAATAGREAE